MLNHGKSSSYPPSWSSDGVQRLFQSRNSIALRTSTNRFDPKKIAGICLACTMPLCAIAVLWGLRRRRRRQTMQAPYPPGPPSKIELPLPMPELSQAHRYFELATLEGSTAEMFVPHHVSEMQAGGSLAWEVPAIERQAELPPRRLIQEWREWLHNRTAMTMLRQSSRAPPPPLALPQTRYRATQQMMVRRQTY